MRICFIDKFGNAEEIQSDFLPQIGMTVDMFYHPFPTVKEVILYPSEETLNNFSGTSHAFHKATRALVIVD